MDTETYTIILLRFPIFINFHYDDITEQKHLTFLRFHLIKISSAFLFYDIRN